MLTHKDALSQAKIEAAPKHTPGPWEVYEQPIADANEAKAELAYQVDHTEPVGPILYLINAGGKCPAVTGCGPASAANARLIAAAPDLLELSLFLIERLNDFERDPLQEEDGEYTLRQFYGHVTPAIDRLRDAISKAEGRS